MTRTIVVTGATGGIGRQTALALAREGFRVVITGRDRERATAALYEIRQASGNSEVQLAIGDLASQRGTLQLAQELRQRFGRSDVINNAGTLQAERRLTLDGGETNFAVKAARSSIWAATSEQLTGRSGLAFDASCRPLKLHSSVLDAALRAQVLARVRTLTAHTIGV